MTTSNSQNAKASVEESPLVSALLGHIKEYYPQKDDKKEEKEEQAQ